MHTPRHQQPYGGYPSDVEPNRDEYAEFYRNNPPHAQGNNRGGRYGQNAYGQSGQYQGQNYQGQHNQGQYQPQYGGRPAYGNDWNSEQTGYGGRNNENQSNYGQSNHGQYGSNQSNQSNQGGFYGEQSNSYPNSYSSQPAMDPYRSTSASRYDYRSSGPGAYNGGEGRGYGQGQNGQNQYGQTQYGERSRGEFDFDENARRYGARTGQPGGTSYGTSYETSYGSQAGQQSGSRRTGKTPKGYTRSDERIKEEINDQLMLNDRIDPSDIEVAVSGGEVTLTGAVASRSEKFLVEQLADGVLGVKDVINQLRTQRSSDSSNDGSAKRDSTSRDAGNRSANTTSSGGSTSSSSSSTDPNAGQAEPKWGGNSGTSNRKPLTTSGR